MFDLFGSKESGRKDKSLLSEILGTPDSNLDSVLSGVKKNNTLLLGHTYYLSNIDKNVVTLYNNQIKVLENQSLILERLSILEKNISDINNIFLKSQKDLEIMSSESDFSL